LVKAKILAVFLGLAVLAYPAIGSAQIVNAIKITGLQRISPDVARSRIHQLVGAALDLKQVSLDIVSLYELGVFDDVQAVTAPVGTGVALVYQVKERPWLDKIKIKGNDEISTDDLKKELVVQAGEILDMDKITATQKAILDKYKSEGFLFADVSVQIKRKPANLVDLVLNIRERSKVKIHAIRFIGNKTLPDKELQEHISSHPGNFLSFLTSTGKFDQEQVNLDRQRLAFYYSTKGFAEVQIAQPIVEIFRDRGMMDITFTIHEGMKFDVGKVSLSGDFLCKKRKGKACRKFIESRLQLKKGRVFSAMDIQKDDTALTQYLQDMGYAFANVSNQPVIHHDTRLIDLNYHISKGKKAKFGRITVRGNKSTRDWTIRRELKVYEGDWFNQTNLKRSVAMVKRLGFFDDVTYTTRPDPEYPGQVDVTIVVKERNTGVLSAAAGLSSFESFMFQAQVGKKNFLGRGQDLQLQMLISSLRTQFDFSFYDPHFMDSDFTLSLWLHNYDREYYDFSRKSTGGTITVGHWLTDEAGLNGSLAVEWAQTRPGGIRSGTTIQAKNLYQQGLTTSLGVGFWFDNRNDRMFPSNGNYTTLNLTWATPYIGGKYSFIKFVGTTKQYIPLFWKVVMKLQATLGWVINPRGGTIPISERFFCGGIYSVRGFDIYSLSPTVPIPTSYDPGSSLFPYRIGGNKKLELTAEIEVPLVQSMGLRGVVFFDAGNAFAEDEFINPLKFRTSAGFGIRWWSPMGPLRFEWGFPLKRHKGEKSVVFEFTMGGF